MVAEEQNNSDANELSILDQMGILRNQLVQYANLANAGVAKKLTNDGWTKCMTLWGELTEGYGRFRNVIKELVGPDEPDTWTSALTPPFTRHTGGYVMRCAGIVSEAIGRLDSDTATGVRDENAILIATNWRHGTDEMTFGSTPAQVFDALRFHRSVVDASRRLFLDEHYAQAIFEAFKTVNNCVKRLISSELDGEKLMVLAFNESQPLLCINGGANKSEMDERKGFRFLFMGAMTGIRNPKAHENLQQVDLIRTLRYLALASLLVEVAEGSRLPNGRPERKRRLPQ